MHIAPFKEILKGCFLDNRNFDVLGMTFVERGDLKSDVFELAGMAYLPFRLSLIDHF